MAVEDKNDVPTTRVDSDPTLANKQKLLNQSPPVGITVGGRYLIEKELGRGGFGVVYLARDRQLLSKRVVIKVLRDDLVMDRWVEKKFQQEIEALALIDHPGVVGVLDAGIMPDGKPYLVMQYVEGVTLRSIMKIEGMDLARVARIVRQIGQALAAAHDKGVYHRDLKPENIMIQTMGEGEEYVKLIDFGIATVKDSQIAANEEMTKVFGTISYMAPEQLKGKPTAASDIFTFGVIAYEMATGHVPFYAKTAVELYEKQQQSRMEKPTTLRYSLPQTAEPIMLKALSFYPGDRYAQARDFGEALARALTGETHSASHNWPTGEVAATPTDQTTVPLASLRVALLYKRNAEPDNHVLNLLESQLAAHGHSVFIDRHLTIGVEWAREIERQVREADAVVPLLSAASVTSEMLAYEIQIASESAQKQKGKPALLPIRINYDGPLPEPLAAILNPIQYAFWSTPEDDDRLVEDLFASLWNPGQARPALAQQKLEAVGGAVPLESKFYIVRPTDLELHRALTRGDSIVLIKGARQMGKTSLLARGLQQSRESGAKVVLTDFQKLNASHLESVETLFLTLAELIADQLDLDVMPDQVWNPRRGPSMNFERYIRREVLGHVSEPLVWGMDEVDRLFTCDFASEVFGLFRSWHNERSLDPAGPWRRLTLAIVYATEAHLFITDLNQSPFNVGTRLALEDFTEALVTELNRRYGSPLEGEEEVARFFRLVGGHPYLVRRGLHELSTSGMALADFEAVADRDEGPFGDHLRRILVLLAQDVELCEVVRGVLRGNPCPTMESFYRLRSAGVMSGESARDVRPRCQLYATYLERQLL